MSRTRRPRWPASRWILRSITVFLFLALVRAAAVETAGARAALQEVTNAADQDVPSLAAAERRAARELRMPVWAASRRVATRVRQARVEPGRTAEELRSTIFPGTLSTLHGPPLLQSPGSHSFGLGLWTPIGRPTPPVDSSGGGPTSDSPP